MYEIRKMIDDVFGFNDAFFKYLPSIVDNSLSANGFKTILRRPHNLVEVKDKAGNVIAQRIEIVTTPFTKDDVKVTIKDNVLQVKCGTENKKEEETETVVYRGISSQSYQFSLSIPDSVDKEKIKATNKDGILKIEMPIKQEEETPEEVEIKID